MDKEKRTCPVCHKDYTDYPMVSAKDGTTEICPECGIRETISAIEERGGFRSALSRLVAGMQE